MMFRPLLVVIGLKLGTSLAIAAGNFSGVALAAQYWGCEAPLSPEQVARVHYLAFPQSQGAISDALGCPLWRSRFADWYPLDGGGYLRIDFDWRGRAIAAGWEVI